MQEERSQRSRSGRVRGNSLATTIHKIVCVAGEVGSAPAYHEKP